MNTALKKYMEATAAYLKDCQVDKAATTVQNYAIRLNAFLVHMDEEGFLDGPTTQAVISWKSALKNSGCKINTIHQYLTELRTFSKWAVEMGYYSENPVLARLIPATKHAPYTKLLTTDEILDLFSTARPKGIRKWSWNRNRAIAMLCVGSGIRVSELLHLCPCDLDFISMKITVQEGKGGKYRIVSFPSIAAVAVKAYLNDEIRPSSAGDNDPLFGVLHDGKWCPLTRQALTDIVNRHVKAKANRGDIRAHALRHASASIMLSEGMAMEEIQALLGHSSVQTTEEYAKLLCPSAPVGKANKIFSEMERQAQRGQQELLRSSGT